MQCQANPSCYINTLDFSGQTRTLASLSALAASPCTFMLRCLLSLNLKKQPSMLQTFFLQFPYVFTFTKFKRIRAFVWIRLWFKAIMWLLWSIQSTKTLSMSTVRQFHCLIICVFTKCTFNFLQELFLCIYNLANFLAQEAWLPV